MQLVGDLYRPKELDGAPVLIGVHGGGWQVGDRKFYKSWGNHLARHGYAVFAIDYRLMKPEMSSWPRNVRDCKAAVQFVRAEAREFGLDPERIGMIGDSAGAHLSALVALAGDEPLFASEARGDRRAATGPASKWWSAFTASTTCWRNRNTTRSRGRAIRLSKSCWAGRRWSAANDISRRRRLATLPLTTMRRAFC